MKRKILSAVSAAAVLLGSVTGLYAADTAALSPRASVVIDSDTGYLRGIVGIPTADYVAGQFDGDVSITSPDGAALSGENAVPADSTVSSGGTELARVLVAGDANCDGRINLSDASAMLQKIAKWDVTISAVSADIHEDGKVNLADVSNLLKYVAKWDIEISSPVTFSVAEYGTLYYRLLSNDAETDAAFVAYLKELTGIELPIVTELMPGDKYVTVGDSLYDKYDFIDKTAVDAVDPDRAYIDIYDDNIHIIAKTDAGLEVAAKSLAAMCNEYGLRLPKGYVGPVTHMTERGGLYWDAVENILATEPAVDGTNGMSEDIYVAISNADYTAPKSIIYMIGDGMGKNIATAAELCHYDDLYGGKLAMNYLPVEGRQSTYSTDQQITDSAAGGTALATGYKTANGVVSKNVEMNENYKTLLELAAEKGKDTGIVATKSVTDATPASFTAHANDRSEEVFIAQQQLEKLCDGTLDVILGGGSEFYKNSENADAMANAVQAGLTFTESWDTASEASLPLAGLFTEREMSTDDGSGEPHIAAMTDLALKLLSEDEDGFFLMVEGSKIDTFGHNNDFGTQVDETYEFDCAVAVALRYVALNPDTVLVITADHETGELAIPAEPTVDNIRGSSSRYSSGGHHWVDVPVYAVGYGTEALEVNMENTDVAIFLAELMGEENYGQRSEVCTLVDLTDKDNTDAVLSYLEKGKDAVSVRSDGLLVGYGSGITHLYIPAEAFDVQGEVLSTVGAVRVTYTNLSSKPRLLPYFGVRSEDGTLTMAGERITYLKPGETMTYTYVMPALWKHQTSLKDVKDIVIYTTAGNSVDMLVSEVSITSRPLDK